jgi:hypothetical protein
MSAQVAIERRMRAARLWPLGDRMRNIFAVRIVKVEYKVLYVVLAVMIAFAINSGLTAIGLPRVVGVPIALALSLCIYLYGARVFRGPNEAAAPARPWWKMTTEKRLSTLLALLFVLLSIVFAGVVAVAAALIPVAAEYGPASANEQVLAMEANIPIFLYFAVLAFFYANSAARIPRVVKLSGKFAS